MTFSKKIFALFLSSFFILLFFNINIASAEVTCCGCQGSSRTFNPIIGSYTTGSTHTDFHCTEDTSESCEDVCERLDGGSGWRQIAGVRATGEVVTCCECEDDTRLCNAANRTCDTLCGDHGFEDGGTWKREPSTTSNNEEESSYEVELIPPTLNVDIPGTTNLFGGATIEGEEGKRYFFLPWIGQYAGALYRYILSVIGILAAVVIIFAGAMWMTAGGNAERIKRAQEYVFGAVVGLVIAFGSYLLLYTINPDLVKFGAMKLRIVERIDFEYDLSTTTGFTGGAFGSGMSGSWICRNRETREIPETPPTGECPVEFTVDPTMQDPNREERTRQFVDGIRGQLTGNTRDKVVQAAKAAVRCGVHFGSCGRGVGIINALAGVRETNIDDCLEDPRHDCSWGFPMNHISTSQRNEISLAHCYPATRRYPANTPPGCLTGTEAVTAAYQRLSRDYGSSWPDAWTDRLQPGDVIVVHNANSDRWGNHAAIFMGWEGNRAKVTEGGYGCFVKSGTICIKDDCNPPVPLIKTFRPVESE